MFLRILWRVAIGTLILVGSARGLAGGRPASTTQPATESPQRFSREWKRLASAELEVVGNASEKDLRSALKEVQRFRGTLLALIPGLTAASDQKTILVVFRDTNSFQRFLPRDGRGRKQENVGGYFLVQPYANVMVLPMFVDRDATFRVAFHEYTHYLVYRNMRNLPLWLNEGIADLYSTFSVDAEGRSVVGRAPPWHMATLQSRSLIPLSRFLDPETAARLFEDDADTSFFYAQAWAFVHFMTFGEKRKRQGQILRYLEALETAPSRAEAARMAFGVDLNQLDAELRSYTRQFQLPAMAFNVRETSPAPPPTLEPLTEVNALHLQGRLLADLGASDEADEVLAKALKLDRLHRGARVALGRVRMIQERHGDAIDLLTATADQAPEDFESQYYLAGALAAADRHDESLKSFERAAALNRRSPPTWFGLSLAALALSRDGQAEAAMHQVQGLYSAHSWYYSRAQFALGIGRPEITTRDVAEYLKRAGWGDQSAPYAAFLGVIAHWRLKQESEAASLLTKAALAVRPKSWAAVVVSYLQNGITDDVFLDRARDNGQRTEAHAYIAIRLLLAGRHDEARKHLTWVKERGDRNYTEYGLALAELKRLDGSK